MFRKPLTTVCVYNIQILRFPQKTSVFNEVNKRFLSLNITENTNKQVPKPSTTSTNIGQDYSINSTGNNTNDQDDFLDYEVPKKYFVKEEKVAFRAPTKIFLHKLFNGKFDDFDQIKSSETYQKLSSVRKGKVNHILDIMDLLIRKGFNAKTIFENPFVFKHSYEAVEMKYSLVKLMKPRDVNDFLPLFRLTISQLNKLLNFCCIERNSVPGGHRVYYLCESLNVEPALMAKYLSRRTFMFTMNFEHLSTNLKIFLKYKMPAKNILGDLWVFRYSPEVIEKRLERATCGQKEKLMPWMVRCQDTILNRSIQNTQEKLEIFGEKGDLATYAAARLGYDENIMRSILEKHPNVFNVRAKKIKFILDYLLEEAKFAPHEIAMVPRILCHSLETTRNRLNELAEIGCRPTSLVIVCRSAREYKKFVNHWKAQNEYRKIQSLT